MTTEEWAGKLIDALDAARRSGEVVHEHELTEAAFDEAVTAENAACFAIADEASTWCRSFGAEETAERIAAGIKARRQTT
jgi:hypothetical protein